ncbi:hypothetical protein WN48_08769 [Eufriesea mexicana]|nr:hypothetical protein WN48_08769 [Eufriesea mexicana]
MGSYIQYDVARAEKEARGIAREAYFKNEGSPARTTVQSYMLCEMTRKVGDQRELFHNRHTIHALNSLARHSNQILEGADGIRLFHHEIYPSKTIEKLPDVRESYSRVLHVDHVPPDTLACVKLSKTIVKTIWASEYDTTGRSYHNEVIFAEVEKLVVPAKPAGYQRTDTILWGNGSDCATDGNHPRDCGALVFTMDTSSLDELASDVSAA